MHTSTDTRKGRRRRRRSASPARLEQEREYYNHLLDEYNADEERRSHLSLGEKMAEMGHNLQRHLEQHPEITMLLQPSPPGRMGKAQCRARDCLFEDRSPRQETRIMDDYRIALVSHVRQYFHVSCLEKMLELSSLAPTRFKLDNEPYRWNDSWPWTWGLMLRLWFEHGGRIDLAKIKTYIQSYKKFQKADGEFSTVYLEWHFKNQGECSAETRNCRCPPEPKGPTPPTLEDYKSTTGEPCCLSEVLDHPADDLGGGPQDLLGCQPCSLFDTRVKFDESNDSDEPLDSKAVTRAETSRKGSGEVKIARGRHRKCYDDDTVMPIDSGCDVDDDFSTINDENSNCDSDSYNDGGSDIDSGSNSDVTSVDAPDEDLDTDDDYDAGPEKTRTFLYRHFTIVIVANETPGKANLVFMKATLLHTKGEDNNPRIKTLVIDGENDDPLFSLLDHLISLTAHDDAFEAKSAQQAENIFWVKMPPGRKSLILKWMRDVLDLPVFREKLRGAGESGISPTDPLRASTWIAYLKRLREKAGFQHSFTQYGLRRSLLNVVNNKAPSSVRDQTFDHQQGAVGYYLDQEVRFDTKACYLGRPSNEVVQKMARLASLTADASAPIELFSEQKAKLAVHPHVIKLGQRNKVLMERMRKAGYRSNVPVKYAQINMSESITLGHVTVSAMQHLLGNIPWAPNCEKRNFRRTKYSRERNPKRS